MSLLTSKFALAIAGAGLISLIPTGIYLGNKYSWFSIKASSITQDEENTIPSRTTNISCKDEDGSTLTLGAIEGLNIDDSMRQAVESEFKNSQGQCLTQLVS